MGKFEDIRKRVREDAESARWKYLRKFRDEFFDLHRHSSLPQYLYAIFPGVKDWRYHIPVPETIQEELSAGGVLKIRKHVKPAAFSESLRIIVEVDDISHYIKPFKIVKDEEQDALFRHLHIDTVRIPYWIQLSEANINFLFSELKFSDARVHIEREMCKLKHSFFDSEKMDFGLSISPAAMCPLGFKRFCDEVVRYPTETQRILRDDLSLVSDACMERFGIEAAMKDSNPLFTE